MTKRFLALALLFMAALTAQADVTNIDSTELARLAASGVPVIDIRTPAEWKASGVIAGSRLITFYDENGRADPPQWLAKVKALTTAKQPVILLCRSGKRSAAATQFLAQQAGFTSVYNVAQGLNAWTAEGRPTVQPAP